MVQPEDQVHLCGSGDVGNFYRRMNRRFGELPPIKADSWTTFGEIFQTSQKFVLATPWFPRPSQQRWIETLTLRVSFLSDEFEMRERLGLAPFPLLEVTGTNERSTGGVLASKLRLL